MSDEARKLWTPDPATPVALRFPHRRWWARRTTERGSWWIYLLGERLTLFRYHGGMFSIYVHTKRLTVNWRVYGDLAPKKRRKA